jgi:hypothetical protein
LSTKRRPSRWPGNAKFFKEMLELMKRHAFFLVLVLLLVGRPSAGAAEVGYVNILNGVEPDKAFVVERRGRAITPEDVYTDLEEGDLVKPAAEALLLFTPTDTACEAVEIMDEFTATACPPATGGLKDALYDFVADEFMATPSESVEIFTTRGAKDKRVYSLPPQALRLFVESPALADSLKKTPFVALTANKAKAEALILGQGQVRLLAPRETDGPRFQLPAEGAALRQALLRRIHFKAMADLASPNPWPVAVEWSINIHAPVENGSRDYDGQKWGLVKTMKASDGPAGHIAVKEPCLLTFKIVNRGDTPYYVYLVNYTGNGQVLPFLPPQEKAQMPNLVAAGAELAVDGVFLELGASTEFVRLILSENPLDLRPFGQKSLDEAAGQTTPPARLRPAPADSWFTAVRAFKMK